MMKTKYPNDASLIRTLDKSGKLSGFEKWIADLEAEIRQQYAPQYGLPLHETTGLECWFGFYDDGYSARDALAEDATNA